MRLIRQDRPLQSVIVVGGGLAGLSSACALAEAGYRVRVLEQRPYLGGRASSYQHPGTGEIIDNCQHVLLGNCTNLIDFYQRLKVSDRIRWFGSMTLLEPGGRRSVIHPSWLPAPFHSMPSFWSAAALSIGDKYAIARALGSIGISRDERPQDPDVSMAAWLEQWRQPRQAVERFWRPLLVSALNEDLDRMSSYHARRVIRLSLLASPGAGRIGVPSVPLSQLYSTAEEYLRERDGTVELRSAARGFAWSDEQQTWSVSTDHGEYVADALILALSFEAMARLLPLLPRNDQAESLAAGLCRFEHSPITVIHLWFDRPITDLDHAILLDRTIQWIFHKSQLQPELRSSGDGSYVELVVSASRSMVGMERQSIIALALGELKDFFPETEKARLVKAAVVKEVRATYSILPGLDRLRPDQTSPWMRIFLAGDWTQTGWPATMEGAVRSGYLSAAALTREAGAPREFLARDLAFTGLMSWMHPGRNESNGTR